MKDRMKKLSEVYVNLLEYYQKNYEIKKSIEEVYENDTQFWWILEFLIEYGYIEGFTAEDTVLIGNDEEYSSALFDILHSDEFDSEVRTEIRRRACS